MPLSQIESGFVLQAKHPKHLTGNFNISHNSKDFKSLFFEAVTSVNNDQVKVARMTEQAILDPSSINDHDVTISLARANMSLSMTKAISDRVLRAYQEIINMR